jgi:hypothetical protein
VAKFSYVTLFMGILHVITLALSLHPNPRNEKGSNLGECHKTQVHSNECENVQGREFQHSQVDFHFEN